MLARAVLSFSTITTAVSLARAATYAISDTFIGPSFLTGFNHQVISVPTHATAQNLNLTFASSDTFIMRADSTTVLSTSGPGRNSVRIVSKKQWSTHVEIMDVRHMPQGCSTWPAYRNPAAGLIDIIEGVNDQSPNAATLHTTGTPGCTQPATGRDQTGTTTGTDCNSSSGCGVKAAQTNSYGPSFNTNGGGCYGSVPAQVRNGASWIDTNTWGTPFASFVDDSCDISSKFGMESVMISLTFCGDWAGKPDVYAASGCPSTCVDYVNNNPAAFKGAYWDIAALRVYQ
ncbi:Endo-1,3(4)-beta-glucanase [Ceratobasidium theobromae]|uniref:Endo-1,3(4)-beta-glucanase n=1 Tax=Ceratobasidium theobromae TaxID=1582974 RepID=A0A5N5QI25_9AGAM|nr:Endo-1,3(4)-beta-glucanase [Ceratobasidium theobromae]